MSISVSFYHLYNCASVYSVQYIIQLSLTCYSLRAEWRTARLGKLRWVSTPWQGSWASPPLAVCRSGFVQSWWGSDRVHSHWTSVAEVSIETTAENSLCTVATQTYQSSDAILYPSLYHVTHSVKYLPEFTVFIDSRRAFVKLFLLKRSTIVITVTFVKLLNTRSTSLVLESS